MGGLCSRNFREGGTPQDQVDYSLRARVQVYDGVPLEQIFVGRRGEAGVSPRSPPPSSPGHITQ